jgi:hypothetical protein
MFGVCVRVPRESANDAAVEGAGLDAEDRARARSALARVTYEHGSSPLPLGCIDVGVRRIQNA